MPVLTFFFSLSMIYLIHTICTKIYQKVKYLKFYHIFSKKSIVQIIQIVRTKQQKYVPKLYKLHNKNTYHTNKFLFFVDLHKVRTFTSTYFYIIMSVGQVKKTSPHNYIKPIAKGGNR